MGGSMVKRWRTLNWFNSYLKECNHVWQAKLHWKGWKGLLNHGLKFKTLVSNLSLCFWCNTCPDNKYISWSIIIHLQVWASCDSLSWRLYHWDGDDHSSCQHWIHCLGGEDGWAEALVAERQWVCEERGVDPSHISFQENSYTGTYWHKILAIQ